MQSNLPVSNQVSKLPRIAILGWGRAGKDSSGMWLGKHTPLRYVGSTSNVVNPMIAKSLGISEDDCWNNRHQDRAYWKKWCCEYRKDDLTKLARKCLETGDLVIGLRDKLELDACLDKNLLDLTIWIENERVSPDPTVTFTKEDCDIIILNNTTLSDLYHRLYRLAKVLRIPVTICRCMD